MVFHLPDKSGINKEKEMKRAIITVLGKDTVGIIARVCTYLAEHEVNILDISQTLSLIHI